MTVDTESATIVAKTHSIRHAVFSLVFSHGWHVTDRFYVTCLEPAKWDFVPIDPLTPLSQTCED